ncbi:MAG: hypothetical protein ACE5NN_05410 [Candidatus Bathyarchaeia archaeon]
MPKGIQKGMKLIRAPEDLVARLSEASNREGKPFLEYITEAFEQALRAHEMNRSVKEIVDFYELMMMQKDAGMVVTPSETLNGLIQRLYRSDKEFLQKLWFDSGRWYGKYLLAKVGDGDPVELFVEVLKVTGWNLKDAEFKRNDDSIVFRCISFTLSMENTVLLMKFVEGVMTTLGYEVTNRDCMRGMINLNFGPVKSKS